ncbi:MAG: helix-turn-helix domain-containing protein [Bacteroidaceae bacterium]|nr:helix-turn-helix domain-containing protein [Bacteroidaceae bacterium]
MGTLSEISVTPSKIQSMIPSVSSVGLGDDLFISRLMDTPQYKYLKYPFRIDCFLAAYCVEGSVECYVNLTQYHLTSGTLLLITPGNIVKITQSDAPTGRQRFTVICASADFIASAGINPSKFLLEAIEVLRDPCMHLSDDEAGMLKKYVDLTLDIAKAQPQFTRECIGGLVTSVFYQFAGFLNASKRKEELETPVTSTRQRQMMEQFMKLAITDHAKEHLVGYYADKLCVTPKYLSKIIKETSGRSVPEWLNELLILDAKNMLRHSNMTIKEISAQLHFPSQSFFFRFFKNHTGQTPTQYREE